MVRLGLSVTEFLNLDMAEFNALAKEYNDKVTEELQVDRLLTAHIMNSSGMMKKAVKPEDLFFLPTDKKAGFTKDQLKELNTWRKKNTK